MRKFILPLILLFLTTGLFASESVVTPVENIRDLQTNVKIQPIFLMTNQVGWKVVDATTMAGAEPNDLTATTGAGGYGGRTYQGVIRDTNSGALEVSIVTVPSSWNGIRLRCIGVTDGNTVTYQVYGGSIPDVNSNGAIPSGSNCALAYYGQLAWTIGGQVSDTAGYKFASQVTVTITNQDHTATWSYNSTDDDRVGECRIDLLGDNILIFVPTVVNCNSKLLAKGY